MKFRKTLASVCAASVALSSLAVSAFAAWKGADKDGNVAFDVSSFLPKGVELSEVYGVKVTVTDASADAIAKGAGGGIVYNTSRGWNQKSWCNGCDKEEHDFQFDAATKSITRLDDTPAFQADDEWMSLTLSEWWGDDEIEVAKIEVLNKDGVVLPIAEEPTPVEPADPVDPSDPADPVAPGTSEDVEETVDIAIKNAGKTVIDNKLVRTNIINGWAGDEACVIANKDDFKNAVKVKVKFTVSNFTTPFKAWISMADSSYGCQFWGEGDKGNVGATCVPVEVTGNGTYDAGADDRPCQGYDRPGVLAQDRQASARSARRVGRGAPPERPDRRLLENLHLRAQLHLPGTRVQLPHGAGRCAQTQGDLLHPRRGLPCRRNETRSDRPDRRRDADHRHRDAGSHLRKDRQQHRGDQGVRHHDGLRGHRDQIIHARSGPAHPGLNAHVRKRTRYER